MASGISDSFQSFRCFLGHPHSPPWNSGERWFSGRADQHFRNAGEGGGGLGTGKLDSCPLIAHSCLSRPNPICSLLSAGLTARCFQCFPLCPCSCLQRKAGTQARDRGSLAPAPPYQVVVVSGKRACKLQQGQARPGRGLQARSALGLQTAALPLVPPLADARSGDVSGLGILGSFGSCSALSGLCLPGFSSPIFQAGDFFFFFFKPHSHPSVQSGPANTLLEAPGWGRGWSTAPSPSRQIPSTTSLCPHFWVSQSLPLPHTLPGLCRRLAEHMLAGCLLSAVYPPLPTKLMFLLAHLLPVPACHSRGAPSRPPRDHLSPLGVREAVGAQAAGASGVSGLPWSWEAFMDVGIWPDPPGSQAHVPQWPAHLLPLLPGDLIYLCLGKLCCMRRLHALGWVY